MDEDAIFHTIWYASVYNLKLNNYYSEETVKRFKERAEAFLQKNGDTNLEGLFSRVLKPREETGTGVYHARSRTSRYLRARQGRFSVNLRVIPVISCLENHAVALMLHCLSYAPSPLHSDYTGRTTPSLLPLF